VAIPGPPRQSRRRGSPADCEVPSVRGCDASVHDHEDAMTTSPGEMPPDWSHHVQGRHVREVWRPSGIPVVGKGR
jgi:hypothetical protein